MLTGSQVAFNGSQPFEFILSSTDVASGSCEINLHVAHSGSGDVTTNHKIHFYIIN
jgi:hypothetical protein